MNDASAFNRRLQALVVIAIWVWGLYLAVGMYRAELRAESLKRSLVQLEKQLETLPTQEQPEADASRIQERIARLKAQIDAAPTRGLIKSSILLGSVTLFLGFWLGILYLRGRRVDEPESVESPVV